MKLATYKDGSRDGQLVVVSRDLSIAHFAPGIASRLQQVLDDWNFLSPQLQELSQTLNHGKARHAFAFEPHLCMAPLPRAYQWLDALAYPSHLERIRRSRGAELPDGWLESPLMYQGASDDFLGPCDAIACAGAEFGIDFEGEVAAITADVALGTTADAGLESVRLLMLANDVSLRHLAPAEVASGLGLIQSKPATAFSPVAVTPDELGDAWHDGRVHLNLESVCNGQRVGLCDAAEMAFHFGQLIAHACRTRNLRAGTVMGSGTVSNRDAQRGFACLAEKRAVEALSGQATLSEYLRDGDRIRIEMRDALGASVFGAIDQRVAVPA